MINRDATKNAMLPSRVLPKIEILPNNFPTKAAIVSEIIRKSILTIAISLGNNIMAKIAEKRKYVDPIKLDASFSLNTLPKKYFLKIEARP